MAKWGGGNREGQTGRGQRGGGDGEEGNREGETGRRAIMRRRWGGGKGEEEMGRGAIRREGREVSQAHGIPGWNEVTVFSDFAYPRNAGYPS